jgi:hypothetical protein
MRRAEPHGAPKPAPTNLQIYVAGSNQPQSAKHLSRRLHPVRDRNFRPVSDLVESKTGLDLCAAAFSRREPATASPENAPKRDHFKLRRIALYPLLIL